MVALVRVRCTQAIVVACGVNLALSWCSPLLCQPESEMGGAWWQQAVI